MGVENSILKIKRLKIPQWDLVRTKEQSHTEVGGGAQEMPQHTSAQAGRHWWQPEEVAEAVSDSREQRQRKPLPSETRSLETTVAPTGLGEQVAQVRIRWNVTKIGLGKIGLLSRSRSRKSTG